MLVILVVLFASGCAQKGANETRSVENVSKNLTGEKNIVETLSGENFGTLAKLIGVAGLGDTLAKDGPYTIFAPTDKAFAAIPASAVQELMNNKTESRKVLTYHIANGKLMEKDIANMTSIQTLEGGALPVTKTAGGLQVGGANITKADIQSSNGVIHQIDKVLIPPK